LTKVQDNDIVVSLIPVFQPNGNLPPGIHWEVWVEIEKRFGQTFHRRGLLRGLSQAIALLLEAGCSALYVDGSFVTAKEQPGDFDACWDLAGVDPDHLDPIFLEFDNGRAAQKARFGGELFPAQFPADWSGTTYLQFFQTDRDTGAPKGIIGIDLKRWRV
jgi:hypothetical protein